MELGGVEEDEEVVRSRDFFFCDYVVAVSCGCGCYCWFLEA